MLKDELLNDPLGLNYAAMTDAEAAASLNDVNRIVNKRVQVSELLKYLGGIGKLGDFIEAKTDASAAKRKPVLAVFSLFENPHITDIDVAVEPFAQGLGALVAANLITQPEADTIIAMGSETVSRAQEIGAGKVYEATVRKARG